MPPKHKVEEYQKKLEAEQERLLKDLKDSERHESYGSDTDSFDEETDEAEEFAAKVAAAQALRDRINEIDMILNKIRMGTYGVCKNCGGEISENILGPFPQSPLCERCKK